MSWQQPQQQVMMMVVPQQNSQNNIVVTQEIATKCKSYILHTTVMEIYMRQKELHDKTKHWNQVVHMGFMMNDFMNFIRPKLPVDPSLTSVVYYNGLNMTEFYNDSTIISRMLANSDNVTTRDFLGWYIFSFGTLDEIRRNKLEHLLSIN